MSLTIYPRQAPEHGREQIVARSPTARHCAFPPKANPERMLVGILARMALFYLLGKAVGLGGNPTES